MPSVLIVDDTASFRAPITALLRLRGYGTHTASNGREGLELARRHRPDLILLDLAMPEMDGLSFLRERARDAQLVHIPVILLTAITDKAHLAEAQALGIERHLLKSQFSVTQILNEISQRISTPLTERD